MRVAQFINQHMIKLLMGLIVLGLLVGYMLPGTGKKLQALYPGALFVMLYPMMVGIKINEVTGAARRLGFMTAVLVFNYFISPLLAALLAQVFLAGYPDFAVGLILTGVVPCAGMIVAWTALAKGNAPMTLVITVTSFLAGIVLIPLWMSALAGKYVPVDTFKMLQTILYTIVIPLLLGNLTRVWLVKKWGPKKFMELKPVFPAVSALGMYMVFFISMMAESVTLVHNPQYLGIIAVPLVVFYTLLFSISVLYARLTRTNYPDMVALAYGVSGKNISIALALAVVFFPPLTVMIIAIKPLIQVLFMAGFFRLTPVLHKYWVNVLPQTGK
ncbi:Arsenite efflux pump ArsB, ACR3 family [Desulfotomaculum arcticum]|uniref:Arsenite efflux pump ArsB, ACR3 family n=1 Tax=Desulfotruncus arcticus DSM 17038 TaxID=1121424 RepID=A0A1I2UWB0_9FIRM|nr:bile acid:sodium symporter [Desulfotruncus arcticus]SFG81425.1 Arsenite efflux pump ArsB, ACR3 family [Desulfotomaculum arcticum] [Desulfotruncus arcticus DSM 17038]